MKKKISSLLIFTKYPEAGSVKTRLFEKTELNELDTSQLAEAMLKDTICLANRSNVDEIHIGYSPLEKLEEFKNLIENFIKKEKITKTIKFYPQSGDDFDERFGSVVKLSNDDGTDIVLVVGADLPYLDHLVINKALEKMEENNRKEKIIVIGPSTAGGIYLVGVNNSFNPGWFKKYKLFRGGIELTQFINFCSNLNYKMYVLPPYGDIDLEEDLLSLILYIKTISNCWECSGFNYPKYTADIIKQLKISILELSDNTRKRKLIKLK